MIEAGTQEAEGSECAALHRTFGGDGVRVERDGLQVVLHGVAPFKSTNEIGTALQAETMPGGEGGPLNVGRRNAVARSATLTDLQEEEVERSEGASRNAR